MPNSLGIHLSGRIATGMVRDEQPCSALFHFPEGSDDPNALIDTPLEALIERLCEQAQRAIADCGPVAAVGVALPGIVQNGIVEDAPNLAQLKGAHMANGVQQALRDQGIDAPVAIMNDADAIAAGIAAKKGRLHHFIRVWTIGWGIGYGRYPNADGIWEGGHCVVTLDPGETYCGCGGRGHLEGIMGHRAMRLRFLDMEPEEVFANAKTGDERCVKFVRLWHRSLAAATANSIHMQGPGRFYFTGFNARFLDLDLLQNYLQQMVKMSPLQSYTLEVIPMSDDLAVTGAAIAALQAAGQ